MSTDRDMTRIVRSWLRADEHASANRVLDAALDQIATTPQRRASWWPAWRLSAMNTSTRIALGAAAIVLVAILGIRTLGANVGSLGGPSPEPTPSQSVTPLPTPSPSPTPAAVEFVPNGLPDVRVRAVPPEGWTTFESFAISGPTGTGGPLGVGLGFWGIANLYADPLDLQGGLVEPAVGPTVEDLVAALVAHPAWTTTEPMPATVGGYDGEHLRVVLPSDITFRNCDPEAGFWMWTTPAGGRRCAQAPGQIHDMWILDVEGQRLVIAGISFPRTPDADLAALQAFVDSIQIEPPT